MPPQSEPDLLRSDHQLRAIKTLNYLRVAIVVLVFGLFLAVGYEAAIVPGHCFQKSISAYYYTPVRGYFVAALLGVGVCLFCLKGNTDVEDGLLNLAGMFAPVVALVPTPEWDRCASVPGSRDHVSEQVANNMFALSVVGSIGLIVIAVLVRRRLPQLPPYAQMGYAASAVVWIAMTLFFAFDLKGFVGNAHYAAAVPMFICVVAVVFVNALGYKEKTEASSAQNRYTAVGWAMIVTSALVAGGACLGWEHAVIAIEVDLIVLFAAFWIIQTKELWSEGLRET
jgi:hypothetical protein